MILVLASTGSSTPACTLFLTSPLIRSRPNCAKCFFSGRVCSTTALSCNFAPGSKNLACRTDSRCLSMQNAYARADLVLRTAAKPAAKMMVMYDKFDVNHKGQATCAIDSCLLPELRLPGYVLSGSCICKYIAVTLRHCIKLY